MGQRLVVTVQKNNRDLAKIYYHWSAYTTSALHEVGKLVHGIKADKDLADKELQLRLIRICEENGGGIDGGTGSLEYEWITRLFPDEKFEGKNISRNEGLIAISEDGMCDMQECSEGDIIIDLDACRILNSVYHAFSSIEDYNSYVMEELGLDEKKLEEDIPEIMFGIDEIDICDLDGIIDELENLKGDVCRSNGLIYELII